MELALLVEGLPMKELMEGLIVEGGGFWDLATALTELV